VSETLELIQNCPLKTSPHYFIPTALLKECGDEFAPLVCKLANLSFMDVMFPEIFNIGQITPVIKKKRGADTNDPVNYRPNTNLNTISKIIERLANKQLSEHQHLNTFQSAYWSFHSTETAMTKVVNDLLTAVDSGKPSITFVT